MFNKYFLAIEKVVNIILSNTGTCIFTVIQVIINNLTELANQIIHISYKCLHRLKNKPASDTSIII